MARDYAMHTTGREWGQVLWIGPVYMLQLCCIPPALSSVMRSCYNVQIKILKTLKNVENVTKANSEYAIQFSLTETVVVLG